MNNIFVSKFIKATIGFCIFFVCSVVFANDQSVIVKYKDNLAQPQITQHISSANTIASQFGVILSSKRTMYNGAHVLTLDASVSKVQMDQLIQALVDNDKAIEYVEENTVMTINLVPNDPLYSQQWHYFEAVGGIGMENAWEMSSGANVNVAVIDTGIRPHVDLAANIVQGYDFLNRDNDATDPGDGCNGQPSSWHGTHVSGTIAARTNNSVGVAGIAYNSNIVPVRVLGCGGGSLADVADAIVWSSGGGIPNVPNNNNPAHVINLSLGGFGACGGTMQGAINQARSRNSVVVVAAGNNNGNAANQTPANCAGVITVAATDRQGNKAFYSNFGATVEIAAPGGETTPNIGNGVLSTLNTGFVTPGNDNYQFYQGTSMAAPHVAGVAALMKAVEPRLTPDQILAAMQATARPFPGTCVQCGAGILRADQAVYMSIFKLVPLYRYWNETVGDHFYTIDRDDTGYAFYGYQFEQIEGYVRSRPDDNFIPMYRYWNGSLGDHFYTTVRDDDTYALYGYAYEKIEAYVKQNANNGYIPLNRYWNDSIFDHFYTVDRNDEGLSFYGYIYESIEGYVKRTD